MRESKIAQKVEAWTLSETANMAVVRKHLLNAQDFVFRHRVTRPDTVVEVTGREIEELKWSIGRALELL